MEGHILMPALFCSKASSYTSKNRIWHLVGGWDAKTQSTVTASCSCQKRSCTEWTSIASPSPDAQDQCNGVLCTHIVHRKPLPFGHDTRTMPATIGIPKSGHVAIVHHIPLVVFNPLIPLFQEHYPPRNGHTTQLNFFGLFCHSNLNDDQ